MKSSEIDFLKLLGYLFVSNEQAAKGVIVLEGLEVLQPHDRWCMRTLAYAYLIADDFAASLRQTERYVEEFGADRGIALIRGRALWGLGRQQEARDVIAKLAGNLRGTNGT